MLSFDNGTAICHCINKAGKKVATLHVTEEREKPDISVDDEDINSLISKKDIAHVQKIMKLSAIEVKQIIKALGSGNSSSNNSNTAVEQLNDRLKLAITTLRGMTQNNLKTHINFSKSDEIDKLIPLIGGGGFDRSIFLTGPSGSGKTMLSEDIMLHDEKFRPCVIFSKIDEDDSLKRLRKQKLNSKTELEEQRDKKERLIKIRLQTEDDLLNLPSNEMLKNCVCLFDDIDSFPPQIAQFLNVYRDSILESGRHFNITVLSTSHQLYNWAKTRVILNEAESVAMFPHSNKRNSMLFLRDRLGLGKDEIVDIVDEAMNAGRYLICKMSAPNIIITEKSIILL